MAYLWWKTFHLAGVVAGTSGRCRMLNEVPSVRLVTIVMLATFEAQFPTSAGVWAIVALTFGLLIAIQLYARHRRLTAPSVQRAER